MRKKLIDDYRTLHQIIDDGKACRAVATENIWVGYGNPNQQFSWPTTGNAVRAFTTGKEYFAALIAAIESAQEEIYIAGWQVNWDGLLAPGVRLFDALLKAAGREGSKVNIHVMPWDDMSPVQTYDDQAKYALEAINSIVGRQCVFVRLAKAYADDATDLFYSHHQKQVVIDRRIGFIGGMDLAYGRFDDEHYRLKADADGREGMNRYNGCVAWVHDMPAERVVEAADLDGIIDETLRNPFDHHSKTNAGKALEKIRSGAAWQRPGGGAQTLDPSRQPRMPWQDTHCQIIGPAVLDLTRNFVMRWNVAIGLQEYGDTQQRWYAQANRRKHLPGMPELPLPSRPFAPPSTLAPDKCLVQVLRSAPLALRRREYRALPPGLRAQAPQPTQAQDDVQEAMLQLIDKAQHYIYLENQFFVSAFGQLAGYPHAGPNTDPDKGPAKVVLDAMRFDACLATRAAAPRSDREPPKNLIVAALAARLKRVILSGHAEFHVYLTLPVHPEGSLADGTIMAQVHWTMQTLVFGTHSLINEIRRYILAARLARAKQLSAGEALAEVAGYSLDRLEEETGEAWRDYLTLLNLRNWEKLSGGRYVTEQIYVHNKMTLVDDRFAIIGSANINDRSQLGTRDSEIAVLVVDSETSMADLNGNGQPVPVRNFAHQLRLKVWNKIFGFSAGGDKAAMELADAIAHPARPASWKAIQQRARKNAELFEAAFDWVPRNTDPSDNNKKRFSHIWPRWNDTLEDEINNLLRTKKVELNELRNQRRHAPTLHASASLDKQIAVKEKEIADIGMTLNGHYMPFNREFWDKPQHTESGVSGLTQIKGFITELPVNWTRGENNKLPYHTEALVRTEPQYGDNPIRVAQDASERQNEEKT